MAIQLGHQTGTTLLTLLRQPNSSQAWSDFVDRYGPKIYAWCRKWRLQAADAQEVTQEVLMRIAQKLGTYDARKGSFRAWLKTVTHNAACDYRAKQNKCPMPSGGSDGLELLQSIEAREDLVQQLERTFDLELWEQAAANVRRRVSERDWHVFDQLALANRSGADVAHEMELEVATVFVVRSRVQKKLCAEIRRLEGSSTTPSGVDYE